MPAKRTKTESDDTSGNTPKFLAVLPDEYVKRLKVQAVGRGKRASASSLLEEAVASWVDRNRKADPKLFEEDTSETSDKRQFLARMAAELIRDLKVMAIDRNVTASALVRTAVAEWLESTSKGSGAE